jgi:exosortase
MAITAPAGLAMEPRTSEHGGAFPFYAKVALVAGLVILLYAEIFPELASDWWNDPSASQGMLIPPLALYIVWMRRQALLRLPARPSAYGIWALASACLLFLLGKLGYEFFLMRESLVLVLAALVWTFWGTARLKSLGFPFVLLATSIPLPALVYSSLAAPLQLFASEVSTGLAQAIGVTIYRDGNVIQLAGMTLGVAEACSGLHSLSALMVASLLLGYLWSFGFWIRALLFLISIPLAIGVNVVRVAGTAVLADYRPEFAEGFYHSFSGWLVFLGGFGILWAISKALHAMIYKNE